MNSNRKAHPLFPPDDPSGGRTTFIIAIVAVAVVAAAVYLNTLPNGFVWDDNVQILKNLRITDIRYLPQIFSSSLWSFQENPVAVDSYRPIFFVTYMVEHYIFGLKPWGWHLSSIILHSINSVMVFLVAGGLLRQWRDDTSASRQGQAASRRSVGLAPASYPMLFPFIAAVLFAIHPVNTEAVAWVACMVELLYTFFFLFSFHLYMSADLHDGRRRVTYLALSVASFFMGTLSKETAILLIMALPLYDYTKRRLEYRRLKIYIPYLAATGLYMALRLNAMGGMAGSEPILPNYLLQLLNAFPVFTAQLLKLLVPIGLSPFNIYNHISSPLDIKLFASLAVTAGLCVFIWRLQRSLRAILIPCFIITVPLLPTFYMLLYNPDTSNISILSERYLYLPSAGFAICLAMGLRWILGRLGRRRGGAIVLSATLLLAGLYAFGSIRRNGTWKDNYTLWSRTVEAEPDNYFARSYLASVYQEMGENEKALEELLESTRIRPNFIGSRRKLGLLYYSMGQPEKAAMEFEKVLAITPENSGAHHKLGLAYYSMGQTERAEREFEKVLTLTPESPDANYNIAQIYMGYGRWSDAIPKIEKALLYSDGRGVTRMRNALAVSYAGVGRIKEARAQLRMALDTDPEDKETLRNLRNLERLSY
jgi:tetratricopeptide (TPR) repeat protein